MIAEQLFGGFFKNPENLVIRYHLMETFILSWLHTKKNEYIHSKIGDSSAVQLTFEEARDIAGYFGQ